MRDLFGVASSIAAVVIAAIVGDNNCGRLKNWNRQYERRREVQNEK